MKTSRVLLFALTGAIFATGCANHRAGQRIDALRREPGWRAIRATAEMEVARREGNTQWSHSAYYSPQQHTNRVWAVVASGAYPLNTFGDSIDMLIRDDRGVMSYSPRMSHPIK